ncbi:uncharacterized protein LOC135475579 [Liolophura sinensis]|uniref:uncharacterized protein LOC135475579 n=1 Tax=Liolophura sinensis TaxID=3198878 RepID=UPI0031581D18
MDKRTCNVDQGAGTRGRNVNQGADKRTCNVDQGTGTRGHFVLYNGFPPGWGLVENSSNSRAGLYAQCKSIRPDAYLKYHEIHSSVSSSQGDRWEDAQQRRRALHQVILCLLLTAPYEDRFCINKIPRILENSAEDDIDFDVEKVEEAFKELEQYILLIAQSPWKPELHQIKLYNGFYKVKVESRLSRAVDILEIIGFEKTSPDWLQLRTPVNVDWCYKLAFDMFVASAECKLLSSAFRRLVPIGFLPVDIVKGRRYVQGDLDMLETWLVENCKPKSKSHLAKGWDSDRRADTDIVELPIRQHKLTQSGIVRVDSPQRGPIGLESRGSRGRRTVSGYVTEPWSLLRSRAVKAAPFRLTPENYDTPVSQHTSCFEEGTIDDHLAAASLMTMPQEPAKKGLKASVSMSDEWNYVRDGLIQKYGKSYFQGERGDILADTRRVSSFDEKQERGVDLEALDTERNEAPTLPPRIGKNLTKTSYPYSKPNGAAPLDSRLHVHRPPSACSPRLQTR